MMGLQFGLTARFRYVTEPWGEDVIYHFHRRISLIAVGLVVVHPIILIAVGSELLALPDSLTAPRRRLRGDLHRLAHHAGGHGAVAHEAESATRPGTSPTSCSRWSPSQRAAHMVGWGFYLGPLEARLVDRHDVFWIALLLYVRMVKPLLHAAPAVPGGGGPQGTGRHHHAGDAARWPSGFRFSPASSAG